MTTIVQLSDIHMVQEGRQLYGGIDPASRLRCALDRVAALPVPVDLLLLTGDLAENGTVAETRRLASLFTDCTMPIFAMPGNHDDREAVRLIFGQRYMPRSGPANYVVELADLRLIAVDTTVAGQEFGVLNADTLAWLSAELGKSGKPVVLAMHHPPFKSHCSAMDQVGLQNAHELRDAIHPSANIRRIICGHLHRSIFTNLGRWSVSTAPSTSFALPIETSGKLSSFYDEPCGFHLHIHELEEEFVTHVVYIEDRPGPFYF